MTVRAGGRGLPTQTSCLATWGPDRAYVKWLLVDFQVDLRCGPAAVYTLEYGDDIETVEPARPVGVMSDGATLVVSNGVLELVFDERGKPAGVAMNIELQAYGARDPERKLLFRYPGVAEIPAAS